MQIIIVEAPRGDQYRRFIEWACGRSDVVGLVYLYADEMDDDDGASRAYNKKLDAIRTSLKPYLIRDINSIGDYPDTYERDEENAPTREKFPEAFEGIDADRCVPLKKNYWWPGGGTTLVAFPEFGGTEPPDLYVQYYNLSLEVRGLLTAADSLSSWDYPDNPTDPSFFCNGVCWFNSTVHEGQYAILNAGAEECNVLDAMGIDYFTRDVQDEIITIL